MTVLQETSEDPSLHFSCFLISPLYCLQSYFVISDTDCSSWQPSCAQATLFSMFRTCLSDVGDQAYFVRRLVRGALEPSATERHFDIVTECIAGNASRHISSMFLLPTAFVPVRFLLCSCSFYSLIRFNQVKATVQVQDALLQVVRLQPNCMLLSMLESGTVYGTVWV